MERGRWKENVEQNDKIAGRFRFSTLLRTASPWLPSHSSPKDFNEEVGVKRRKICLSESKKKSGRREFSRSDATKERDDPDEDFLSHVMITKPHHSSHHSQEVEEEDSGRRVLITMLVRAKMEETRSIVFLASGVEFVDYYPS